MIELDDLEHNMRGTIPGGRQFAVRGIPTLKAAHAIVDNTERHYGVKLVMQSYRYEPGSGWAVEAEIGG